MVFVYGSVYVWGCVCMGCICMGVYMYGGVCLCVYGGVYVWCLCMAVYMYGVCVYGGVYVWGGVFVCVPKHTNWNTVFLSTSVAAQTAFHSAENLSNSGASVSTSCTRNVSSDPLVGVLAFMTATFSKVSISTP